ncbi:gap protein [Mycolicibacterium celeriflavum]|uniref:GAP family protein n=1 Tax=Mycolicibacterium celeriflavum TaxID=1249101 RepID=UPI0007FE8322|nr:GAP family protein [Mycolicibacterium celeriflavum]OBG17980.1 gap protein [Mycolicibacterium celeriflavum]
MWSSLLGLAFLVAINPVLLAVIVLMISRPRPVQNLLAYWVGGMVMYLCSLLIPLFVLHLIPAFASFSQEMTVPDTSASATARHIQLGMGVLMLLIAAVIVVRSFARQRAYVPAPGGNTPTATSPLGPLGTAAAQDGSAIRRLLGRLQNAWDNGSLWVAFVFGLLGLPPPLLVLFVGATIVGSGAGIGTQVFAVIVFVVAVFSVVEIALLSYLVAPAKTQAILQPLHDWALAHRRHVLVAIFTLVGLFTVSKALGIF